MLRGLERAAGPLSVLADATRRRVYLHVRGRSGPASRDDVAAGLGISRKLAAFHLEKLLTAGLLQAHYARPPGRSGPGAGRTSKYYEPSGLEVEVALPPRRYDLVARLLAEAVAGEPSSARAVLAARDRGRALGAGSRPRNPDDAAGVALRVLAAHGFEPSGADGAVVALRNCPFRALAEQFPGVVCEMNRGFVAGLLEGLGARDVQASGDRDPQDCCVTLRPHRHA